MVSVATKEQMYALYKRGAFGNHLRTWDSFDEWRASGYAGEVSMRVSLTNGGSLCEYRVTPDRAPEIAAAWRKSGISPGQIKVNESAPDELLTIQGEIARTDDGLVVRYNTEVGLKMREAMARATHAYRLEAEFLLRSHLTPASHEDVTALLDRYPGCVIEFSSYAVPLGNCPGRNTIIWEVRGY
jgi:hypothetical protein